MLNEVDAETYIAERLDHQINWYSSRSTFHQKMYIRLQITTIVVAAAIPFLSGYITDQLPIIKLAIGGMGVLVASITAISNLNKYQENWITYRHTSELLIQEKYMYLTRSGPYEKEDAFQHLVEKVESVISEEHSQWTSYMKKNKNGRLNPEMM